VSKKNTIAKVGFDIVSFSDAGLDLLTAEGNASPHPPTARARGSPLLTVQEVAALLRCSVSSLNKWRLTGQGPRFVYVGHRVRYRSTDIAAYIAERTRTSTSATSAPEDVPAA